MVRDAEEHPDLFDLKLPCSPPEVAALEHQLKAKLPTAYREVLERLGQGSFFDNETLLGVHETEEGVGGLLEVNHELHEKQGLDPRYVVFHIGTGGLHAFDTESAGPDYEVVALDEDSLQESDRFETFEAWYTAGVRAHYEGILELD